MVSQKHGMRIAELARRSGTTKETIHFYLREGLLRKPKKTSKNMAYYDETHLEQLKLIKRLRTESYLPLGVIKQVMKEGKLGSSARQLDLAGELFGQGARAEFEPLTKKELAERTGLPEKRISAYEEAKLLRPLAGRTKKYGYEDVRVAEILKQAEDEAGDGAAELVLQRFEILERHMSDLVREEVSHFFHRVLGEGDPRNVLEVLQGGRETIGRFLAVARARRLREEVEAMMPAIEGVMKADTQEPFLYPLSRKVRAELGEPAVKEELLERFEKRIEEVKTVQAAIDHLSSVGDHAEVVERYARLKGRAQASLPVRIRYAEALLHVGKPDDAFSEVERVRQELEKPDAFAEALWGSLCLIRVRHHFSEMHSSTELIGYLARAFSAYEASRGMTSDLLTEARARLIMGRVLVVTPEFLGARPQGRTDLARSLECVQELSQTEEPGLGALEYLEGNALEFMARMVPAHEAGAHRARARKLIEV
jgi:DNA-binding transcriptional MerR regulator